MALEVANKDLLDALSNRHADLEKIQEDCFEWRNKYEMETEKNKGLNETIAGMEKRQAAFELEKTRFEVTSRSLGWG